MVGLRWVDRVGIQFVFSWTRCREMKVEENQMVGLRWVASLEWVGDLFEWVGDLFEFEWVGDLLLVFS